MGRGNANGRMLQTHFLTKYCFVWNTGAQELKNITLVNIKTCFLWTFIDFWTYSWNLRIYKYLNGTTLKCWNFIGFKDLYEACCSDTLPKQQKNTYPVNNLCYKEYASKPFHTSPSIKHDKNTWTLLILELVFTHMQWMEIGPFPFCLSQSVTSFCSLSRAVTEFGVVW